MSSERESWRPVLGYPYEVSDRGRVRRTEAGSNNARPGRVLRARPDRDGYPIVVLCRGGRAQSKKVHRLVCEAFNGEPFAGAQVRHLDGNPRNNTPTNLRWGTAKDNALDRRRHGREARGASAPRALLTEDQVAALRAAYALARAGRQRVPRGWRLEMARQFGVSVYGIATLVAGRGYAT